MAPDRGEVGWDELEKKRLYLWGVTLHASVRVLIYPFTVVKTRQQTAPPRTSFMTTIKEMWREQGHPFYRGFGTNLIPVLWGPLYLFSMEYSRKKLLEATRKLPTELSTYIAWGCSGMTASVIQAALNVPFDVVCQRQMVPASVLSGPLPAFTGDASAASTSSTSSASSTASGKPAPPLSARARVDVPHRSAVEVAREVWRTEGLRGFYRGYFLTIMNNAPTTGIAWVAYQKLNRDLHARFSDKSWANIGVPMIAGGISGGVAAFLCMPLDTIKTRLQVTTRPGMTFRETWRESWKGGYRSFYAGSVPRFLQQMPHSMLMFGAYELLKSLSVVPPASPMAGSTSL